jgi:class 3 adenylate cyclase
MMALTQAGRLDYFGQHVELALALAAGAPPAAVGLSSTVCNYVGVAERLAKLPEQLGMQPLPGGAWVLHVRAQRASARALPPGGGTSATVAL